MIEFVGLRAKKYTYLMDDGSEHKKANRTKKCVIKRGLIKIAILTIKPYYNRNKDLKVIIIMYTPNKSIRLH